MLLLHPQFPVDLEDSVLPRRLSSLSQNLPRSIKRPKNWNAREAPGPPKAHIKERLPIPCLVVGSITASTTGVANYRLCLHSSKSLPLRHHWLDMERVKTNPLQDWPNHLRIDQASSEEFLAHLETAVRQPQSRLHRTVPPLLLKQQIGQAANRATLLPRSSHIMHLLHLVNPRLHRKSTLMYSQKSPRHSFDVGRSLYRSPNRLYLYPSFRPCGYSPIMTTRCPYPVPSVVFVRL